jgi:hypothetical protein
LAINVRAKGQNGEREVVQMLNGIIQHLLTTNPWDPETVAVITKCIQRNQNQSAVGGGDLVGVFGLGIEVKRQENTSLVNTWWAQTVAGAARNNEHPVLLYRKNHQPWRCVTLGHAPLPGGRMGSMRVTFDEGDFRTWFYQWVYYKLIMGDLPRL